MNVRYEIHEELPVEPLLTSLLNLLAETFAKQSASELLAELTYQQARTPLLTLLAFADDQLIGCKLGYERKPGHFYSWLGCVSPSHRGHGIASELMRQQHDWCRGHHYHTVRTQTYNQWHSMLILNLRLGFDITGALQGKHGLMIMLEKKLR